MNQSKEVKHLNAMIFEHINLIVQAQASYDRPPGDCSDVKLYREVMLITLKRLGGELRSMNTRKVELLNSIGAQIDFAQLGQTGLRAGSSS